MNAFSPHGQRIGEAIGAKADTDLYSPGLRSARTSAPWPPIEWPKMPTRAGSTGKLAVMSERSSSVT